LENIYNCKKIIVRALTPGYFFFENWIFVWKFINFSKFSNFGFFGNILEIAKISKTGKYSEI